MFPTLAPFAGKRVKFGILLFFCSFQSKKNINVNHCVNVLTFVKVFFYYAYANSQACCPDEEKKFIQ